MQGLNWINEAVFSTMTQSWPWVSQVADKSSKKVADFLSIFEFDICHKRFAEGSI